MGANQKYSGRVHTKRQLGRAVEHVEAIALVLCEVGSRYQDANPSISKACRYMCDMTTMLESMLDNMRSEL